MDDRWGPDPTHRLWERWRRPVLVLGAIVLIGGQWERLTSGHPFVVVTGIGLAAFWVSLLFTRVAPPPDLKADSGAWRANARRGLLVFGSWTVVAVAWLAAAAVLYSIRPISLVAPAVPALLAASQWWKHRHADRLAAAEQAIGV